MWVIRKYILHLADGAEHHVWLRDAAGGRAFGRSGRLRRRLPGEDRVVGQKEPAAGGRTDRRPAAARGNTVTGSDWIRTNVTTCEIQKHFDYIIWFTYYWSENDQNKWKSLDQTVESPVTECN